MHGETAKLIGIFQCLDFFKNVQLLTK